MKKNPTSKARGITLRDVIAHIQGVSGSLKSDLVARIEQLEKKMNAGFADVRGDIAAVQQKLDREERRREMQTDNLDKRLDDIEVNHLPKIERKLFGRLITSGKR